MAEKTIVNVRDKCTGCEACVATCPKSCISMHRNDEGFLFPVVASDLCVKCGVCRKVCPALNSEQSIEPNKCFIGWNKNNEQRFASSSGGIFVLLAEKIIEEGGVVFGVAITELWQCKTIYVDNKDELFKLLGSKYVQSYIGDSYQKAFEFLSQGRKVLFSGTPCQIYGLKHYLKKDYSNLLTVDVICHGVPSPEVWRKYINEIEQTATLCPAGNNTVSDASLLKKTKRIYIDNCVSFRDKTNGWDEYGFRLSFSKVKKDGKKCNCQISEGRYDNPYMVAFLNDISLRKSCYDCRVKQFKSGSDITLGDAWGVRTVYPEWDDDKGTSLVFANTAKGRKTIGDLQDFSHIEISAGCMLKHNPAAVCSIKKPSRKRKKFFKLLRKVSVSQAVKKTLPPPTYFDKVLWSINRRLKRIKL